MAVDNMQWWDKLKMPPKGALKEIQAGRLKGKSDINPQWRYQAMTETFGPCGVGWKYTIDDLWTLPATGGQLFAFARVTLWVHYDDLGWSDPIPGVGGSMLIEQEKSGLHDSDEGFKMAVTDALSVALKMVGVAADIYLGNANGSKYQRQPQPPRPAPPLPPPPSKPVDTNKPQTINANQNRLLRTMLTATPPVDPAAFKVHFGIESSLDLPAAKMDEAVQWINEQKGRTPGEEG